MKKSLIYISIVLFISSCVVSKKTYETQLSKNARIQKELINSKIEYRNVEIQNIELQKELDSLSITNTNRNDSLNTIIEQLNERINELEKSEIEYITKVKKIRSKLLIKDSTLIVYSGKLEWIRKQNKKLKEQLNIANDEKQTINKLLLDCEARKTTKTKTKTTTIQNTKNSKIITYSNTEYNVFISNSIDKVKMGLKNSNGEYYRSIANLLSDKGQKNILFATNGGMYTQKNNPQGLYIENGKVLAKIDNKTDGYGNFYLQPNGIFIIRKNSASIIKSSDFKKEKVNDIIFATQSGPLLVIDNKIHPKLNEGSKNLNIRSGVGINDKNEIIFIMSKSPVNFFDFATIFKEKYNCRNALYLDGVISKMYMPEVNINDKAGNFGVIIYVLK